MTATVSPATARLALSALAAAWRLGRPERNGGVSAVVLERWRLAFAELEAAASSPERTGSAPIVAAVRPLIAEEVSTAEAAARLGISVRAVQLRIKRGKLSARRVGREWLVTLDRRKEAA